MGFGHSAFHVLIETTQVLSKNVSKVPLPLYSLKRNITNQIRKPHWLSLSEKRHHFALKWHWVEFFAHHKSSTTRSRCIAMHSFNELTLPYSFFIKSSNSKWAHTREAHPSGILNNQPFHKTKTNRSENVPCFDGLIETNPLHTREILLPKVLSHPKPILHNLYFMAYYNQ